jgi:hypothetical protein
MHIQRVVNSKYEFGSLGIVLDFEFRASDLSK